MTQSLTGLYESFRGRKERRGGIQRLIKCLSPECDAESIRNAVDWRFEMSSLFGFCIPEFLKKRNKYWRRRQIKVHDTLSCHLCLNPLSHWEQKSSVGITNLLWHPCLCWVDDIWRWLPLQVYIFDASVLSQSISHLILVLSWVDAADVVSGAYGRQDEVLPRPDKPFISLSSFCLPFISEKRALGLFQSWMPLL